MKLLLILVVMACSLGACHNIKKASGDAEQGYAKVSGKVVNFKKERIAIQLMGVDTLVYLPIDENGVFMGEVLMNGFTYARICNGKFAVPAYLYPGVEMNIEFDVDQIKKMDYSNVKLQGKNIGETKMMLDYYQKQIFPSSQELFVLNPVDFKKKMLEVSAHNLKLVDDYVAANKSLNKKIVDMFKVQLQVPLAASYFYYPMYHGMFCPKDKTPKPEGFNIFDERLPKNDIEVYNKVYRYKTYEVSFWNNAILAKVAQFQGNMVKFANAYVDVLKALKINQQIKDDVANNLMNQFYNQLSEDGKAVLKSRYKEVMKNKKYISILENKMQ